MKGDGTCFYHTIAYHLGLGKENGSKIREKLCDKFDIIKNDFEIFFREKNGNVVTSEEYKQGICTDAWVEDLEIKAIAKMLLDDEFNKGPKNLYIVNKLGKTIAQYFKDDEGKIDMKYITELSIKDYDEKQNIFITYTGNHYDVLEMKSKTNSSTSGGKKNKRNKKSKKNKKSKMNKKSKKNK